MHFETLLFFLFQVGLLMGLKEEPLQLITFTAMPKVFNLFLWVGSRVNLTWLAISQLHPTA